jgi:hypothetical protein
MDKRINLFWALFMVLIGATGRFDLTIIARVPVAELIAFGSIPFLMRGRSLPSASPRFKWIVIFLLLWALGVAISDLYNANHFARFIRGVMKPTFCALWFLFYYSITLKDYRLLLFPPIGAILAALQNYVMPQAYTAESIAAGGYEAVAFGVVPIITSIFGCAGIWLYRYNRLYTVATFFMTATVLALIGAPRSSVAMSLIAAGVIAYIWWTRGVGRRSFRLSIGRLVWMGILGVVGVSVIFYTYQYMASMGWFGEQQLRKYTQQSEQTIFGNSPLGIILGGRPQIFGAILAIIDKPVLGFGSWTAWMMTDYFYEASSIVGADTNMMERLMQTGEVAGVGHSIVLVAWLENGVLALLGVLGVAYAYFKVFIATMERDSRIAPLIVGIFCIFCWNFLFSPFDAGTRKQVGLIFALYVLNFPFMPYLNQLRRKA